MTLGSSTCWDLASPIALHYSPAAIDCHLYQLWRTYLQRLVILVGASMDGAAAIANAIAHPEAVARLVLIDSIDSMGYTGPPPYVQWLVPPLDALAVEYLR